MQHYYVNSIHDKTLWPLHIFSVHQIKCRTTKGKLIDGPIVHQCTEYYFEDWHYHILLRRYSQNYHTYNSMAKYTYPNFNWEYRMVAPLQRRNLNMF